MKAVILGRVSTDDKDQDPENQLAALRALAQRKGWEIVKEIRIEGKSAWDEKESKEVRRMVLEPIQRGRADILAVWAMDRIYRGPPLGIFSLLTEIERLGGSFFSIREEFLSTAGLPPHLRDLFVHIFSYIANAESEQRSERLKASYSTKAAHAQAGGGRAIWGRGRVPTPQDRQDILFLSGGGLSLREIAKRTGIPKSTVANVLKRADVHPEPDGQVEPSRRAMRAKTGEDLDR